MSPAPNTVEFLSGQWVPLSSSWISAARWTAPEQGTRGLLDVKTKKGQTIHYAGCDEALFRGFLRAGSKGVFLNVNLKVRLMHLGTS